MHDFEGVLRGRCVTTGCSCYNYTGSGLACGACQCKSGHHLLIHAPVHVHRRPSNKEDKGERSEDIQTTPAVRNWISICHQVLDRRALVISSIDSLTSEWTTADLWSFLDDGGIQTLRCAAMHWHSSADVVYRMIRTFYWLAILHASPRFRQSKRAVSQEYSIPERLLQAGALDAVQDGMSRFPGNAQVQEWSMRFLLFLLQDRAVSAALTSNPWACLVFQAKSTFISLGKPGLLALADQAIRDLQGIRSGQHPSSGLPFAHFPETKRHTCPPVMPL